MDKEFIKRALHVTSFNLSASDFESIKHKKEIQYIFNMHFFPKFDLDQTIDAVDMNKLNSIISKLKSEDAAMFAKMHNYNLKGVGPGEVTLYFLINSAHLGGGSSAGVDIVGFLAEQFGNAFGFAIGDKLVNGTGTVEPTGFLPVAGTGVTGSTGVAGAFTADNVIDLIYSLDGSLRNRPSFAMLANSTSIAALRKLKDTAGNYVFQVGDSKDRRDLVLGVPVIETPAMPNPGVGANSLAVGDLKSLYIRNAGGLQVDRSDDFAFGNDLATWRATWRIDGALIQKANIKKFKGGAS